MGGKGTQWQTLTGGSVPSSRAMPAQVDRTALALPMAALTDVYLSHMAGAVQSVWASVGSTTAMGQG